jgi:acetolactate synthase-1/2/3 large subunit
MLVISSVQSRSQLGGGRGKLHELPNQSALVGGVAAFSHTLMSAAELPGVLARAFALFQAGRPRPVHIEIPLDVLVEEADDLLASVPVNIDRAGASPSAINRMTALLAGAKRPLILAGGGAIDAAAELTELAELLDAPVALTINAKGMLESNHPLLIGSTQSLVATRALVAEADVVLAIGTELAETDYDVTFAGGFEIPGVLLRVDIDPDQTVRNYPPKVALVADSRNAAQALLSELSTTRWPSAATIGARSVPHACATNWPPPGTRRPLPRPASWKPSCTNCQTQSLSAIRPNRCTPAT